MTRIHRGKTRRTRRVAFGPGRIAGSDLAVRLGAVGLADDDRSLQDMPIEEFRAALGRRIAMSINRWPGCREPQCKRARGCMAPRGGCSNAKRLALDPMQTARMLARLRRRLAAAAARDAAEGVDASPPGDEARR